jgi:catecholate siderophore receptor
MSEYIRGHKRQIGLATAQGNAPQPPDKKSAIQTTLRNPLSHAAVGIASVMLATTSVTAQDAAAPSPQSGTPSASSNQNTAPSQGATSQSATQLPKIRVRSTRRTARPVRTAPVAPAQVAPSAGPAGTAPSYQATQQSITRLPTPLRDTPQTVNVVTQKVLQDRKITSMEDALRTVPGITFQAGEGGQQGDTPVIRGFVARTDIFRDGIRDPGWYTRDLFNADRVEVYKGPSAYAFGRGSTGGAINIVTKLPTGEKFVESTSTLTSEGGYRQELDASGKTESRYGTVLGRVVAMYQDIDTPDRDNVYTKRWGVAPSVVVNFTPNTKALISYIYQGEESIPDYGWPYLPAPTRNARTGALTNGGYYGTGAATPPVPIPRNNWFGVAGGPLADVVQTDTHIGTIKFEHDVTNDIKFTNATRYINNERFARPTAPRGLAQANNTTAVTPGYPVEQMTIGRQHFQTETDNTLLINQADLTGKFRTGWLEHTFATGVEIARETRFQQRARGMDNNNLCVQTNASCRTSLYNPVDTDFGGVFNGYNNPNNTTSVNFGIYAFDQVKFNEFFELLGSIRYDNFSSDFTDLNTSPVTNLSRRDEMVSWRVGGIFHPTTNSSIYAAYGVSYNPAAEFQTLSSTGSNAASSLLDPEKNTTIEIGTKVDLLNNRLSLTGAIFRIEKTNLRIPIDPITNTALVLDGLARVDGVELGVAGNVTNKWAVFAGYSYLNSEIVQTTNLAELGRQLPNTPPHNLAFWTTYDITSEWTVGGGVTYASDTFVNTTNTSFVPEYYKVDLMTSYKVAKNATLQLNIYNLTDEMYFAQYYQGHAVPASGRWASLSYRVKFVPPEEITTPVRASAKPTGYFR